MPPAGAAERRRDREIANSAHSSIHARMKLKISVKHVISV
jgi:hypothetical protein